MNNYGRGVRGSCFNFMLLEGKITVFFLTVFIENENINFLPRFANFCDNGAKFLFSACAGGLFYLPHKHPWKYLFIYLSYILQKCHVTQSWSTISQEFISAITIFPSLLTPSQHQFFSHDSDLTTSIVCLYVCTSVIKTP